MASGGRRRPRTRLDAEARETAVESAKCGILQGFAPCIWALSQGTEMSEFGLCKQGRGRAEDGVVRCKVGLEAGTHAGSA
eukprot:2307544-Rhodomonas_salina.1